MAKKHAWLAGLLNFFTLGLGYIYNGKRVLFGVLVLIGAGLAAYVEFSLKAAAPALYPYSFASFLILAVATAIDGYKEAKMMM